MKNLFMTLALVITSALLGLAPDTAVACDTQVVCGPVVPDAAYQGGGVEVQTVQATACFTQDIATAITRDDGTVEYTVALVYDPGRGLHEVIRTERNTYCWTQNVVPGSWMAVYVTCRTYHGWVAVQVTVAGTYTMVRQPHWGFPENI